MISIFFLGCELPMTDINELKAKELESLNNEEIFDIESLIVDGDNARIHVEIDFPLYKNGEVIYKKYGAIIKPLPSIEFTNAAQIGLKNEDTDVNTEIVKRGLCTKDGGQFPANVVEKLPAGVIIKLTEKICEISGITQNDDTQTELVKQVMGF